MRPDPARGSLITVAIIALTLPLLARGQTPAPPPARPVRAVLTSVGLPSVVDTPLYFRLLRVGLPAGVGYTAAHGMVYHLSGAEVAATAAGDRVSLREGDAVAITRDKPRALRTTGAESAVLLQFSLLRPDELGAPAESTGAMVVELYRTAAAVPGLKAGPYESSLTRVTFPPRIPFNPPHHRSGAALYYILSGNGLIRFGGKSESRAAGSTQYEPHDFVHQWANPGDQPLVLLQANISQEGVPAVIFVPGAR
jgi:mannose-6-phosphate isomerase-like protein (cupin superfamily)